MKYLYSSFVRLSQSNVSYCHKRPQTFTQTFMLEERQLRINFKDMKLFGASVRTLVLPLTYFGAKSMNREIFSIYVIIFSPC